MRCKAGVQAVLVAVKLSPTASLHARLDALAAERRRFGYRRLVVMLRRECLHVDASRTYRVYHAANLQVRKRIKRRVALGRGDPAPRASQTSLVAGLFCTIPYAWSQDPSADRGR